MRNYLAATITISVFCSMSAAHADIVTCRAHATTEGSFFSSRKYTAIDEFPNTSQLDTFKRLDIRILKNGWRVSQVDKDLGIISAAQDVQESNGKQVNLNVVVEPLGAHGSKATMTLQLGFGQVSFGDQLQSMCETLSDGSSPPQ